MMHVFLYGKDFKCRLSALNMKQELLEERQNIVEKAIAMLRKNPDMVKFSNEHPIGNYIEVKEGSIDYYVYVADAHETEKPVIMGTYYESYFSKAAEICAKSIAFPLVKIGEFLFRFLTY